MLVINADDFYGAAAYRAAADCFASLAKSSADEYFMVGYRLRNTSRPMDRWPGASAARTPRASSPT